MGNQVEGSFKGTDDVNTKLANVINDEAAFAEFKSVLDSNAAAKTEFEALLTSNGCSADYFWKSNDPYQELDSLCSEDRQKLADGIIAHLKK